MPHTLRKVFPLVAALAFGVTGFAVHADSSSASSVASESIGSSSTSIQKSSDSSSNRNQVAQGQYTIMEVVALAQQPGMVRLRLQGLAPLQAEEFFLLLPRQTLAQGQLALGDVVDAQPRVYGVSFAAVDAQGSVRPFFVVLDDAWYRELDSRLVAL